MRQQITEEQRYVMVKKRVDKIRKFYKHLATYILVNTFLSIIFIVGDIYDGDTFNEAFWDYHNYKIWLYWGIGILFQAISTFGLPLFLSKDWEQRKINEYLEQQNNRR